jgi:hypothetical protein
MLMWGWRGAASAEEATLRVIEILGKKGYVSSHSGGRRSGAPAFVRVVSDGDGGTLISSWGAIAGDEIAAALSRSFSIGGRYVEVELQDREVTAIARDVSTDGTLGPSEDLDEEASETCEEWFEGKKYRSEAADDLVAIFLGLDDGMPTGGQEHAFVSSGRARVHALLEAVREGATWEKTTIEGRDALRVKDAAGTRISVLSADEIAQFESALKG